MNQPPPIPGSDDRFGHDAEGTLPLEPLSPPDPGAPPAVPIPPSYTAAPPDYAPPTVPGVIFVPPNSNSAAFVMLLGIGSIPMSFTGICFCGVPALVGLSMGIIAWFWGAGEIKRIQAGQLPVSARSQYQVGRVCGLIGAILSLLMIAFFVVRIIASAQNAFANAPMNSP